MVCQLSEENRLESSKDCADCLRIEFHDDSIGLTFSGPLPLSTLHWSPFRYHLCNAKTDSFPSRHASSFSVERVSERLVFFDNTTISLATNAGANTPRGLPLQLALVGCVACCISPHCAAPSVSQWTAIGCLRGQITRLGQGMIPSESGYSR